MSVKLIAKSIWLNPGNRGHRLTKCFKALLWQLAKRLQCRHKQIRLANGAIFLAYPDCVISSALIYANWPEFHELSYVRRVIKRGEAVVDVGANVGHISLLLSDIVGSEHLYAYEPTPVTFRRLCENWIANKWEVSNLFHTAVGAQNGSVRIPDSTGPETKNSLISGNLCEPTVEVPLVSLDECRSKWARQRVGFLKIDVEGYEPSVFSGAFKFLEQDRPRLIMFESLTGQMDPQIATILHDARFKVFELDDKGLPRLTSLANQNLFAVPEECPV